MPPIVTPTSSMTGSDSNNSVIAVFVKAGTGANSLGMLAGGASDAYFAKIGLIDTATLNNETTIASREAENSKIDIKVIGQKKSSMISIEALIATNAVKSCSKGYIADYYADADGLDIPDEAIDFEGEAMLVYLDEDAAWDAVADLSHNGIEWWKSVKIIGNGSKTFDGTSSAKYMFEIHLQRHSSGNSIKDVPANDASGIDVTTEAVLFADITA